MLNISEENQRKLMNLRNKLMENGYEVEEEQPTVPERTYSAEEEKALDETMKIWKVSKEQASMLYKSFGNLKMLAYANHIRTMLNEKKATYGKLYEILKNDHSFINAFESAEQKYYDNYEAILGGDLTPAEIYVTRRINENLEKIITERRERYQQLKVRYPAIGGIIYYGQMIDMMNADVTIVRKNAKENQDVRLLPGLRKARKEEVER